MTYTAKSKVRTRESSERIKRLDAIYGRVLELRNFEIQNLNTRNTFILAINLALLAYVVDKKIDGILLPFLGLIISLLQIGMAAGAKFWQEVWEIKLGEVERELYKVYQEENRNSPQDNFIYLFSHEELWSNEIFSNILKQKVKNRLNQNQYSNNLNKNCIIKGFNLRNQVINCLVWQKFSVSRIPIYIGIIISILWIVLLLCNIMHMKSISKLLLLTYGCK